MLHGCFWQAPEDGLDLRLDDFREPAQLRVMRQLKLATCTVVAIEPLKSESQKRQGVRAVGALLHQLVHEPRFDLEVLTVNAHPLDRASNHLRKARVRHWEKII